ncbi:LysM peptidoglycan-binding domain-containing protein [Vibrio astriarenae]|uniref:LysM peptidoglycan-binding domain-containing protein n=1 Tax=Vibrio astriarenae TaxID=1481923 RepID=A0A7Z2T0G6_9VIBR|nr:LysM peptidoglycan-binding domain-containing protein [Vibrio astriarenae]QIA62109.1 LysM peptidoglycan-binding domain-containing protein [Vibrio astriarenae]
MKRYLRQFVATTFACLLTLSLSLGVEANVLSIKQDAPKTYTVIKGDTLWEISSLYLDSPWLWPRLWQMNPEIENPHLIYPGDKLSLEWRNGQPMLTLKPMVKLSPKARKQAKPPIKAVREELFLPYLKSHRLLDTQQLHSAERVVGASDGRRYLTDANLIYISGQQPPSRWGIYREMRTFDVDGREVTALKKIAEGEVVTSDEELSALSVSIQYQEIMAGDIVLSDIGTEEALLNPTFYPQPGPSGSVSKILGSLEGSQYSGSNDVVVVSGGRDQGFEQGSMFQLYQKGVSSKLEQHQDKQYQLPSVAVGYLMVIRPYRDYSLALVTQATAPIGIDTELMAPNPEGTH